MRTAAMYDALPAYLGGKRRLMPAIFGALATALPPSEWPGTALLDPFLGGGSVSLYAKARGFRVACNDAALRSAVVGRALIANSTVRLHRADIDRLYCEPAERYSRRAQQRHCPETFTPAQADWIDRALYWTSRPDLPSVKADLLRLLLIKWVLRCQPMSSLTASDARAASAGDYDRISPARLGHYVRARTNLDPNAVWRMATQINGAVFAGSGSASQDDAVAFLRTHSGTVVYLDPPYPGTMGYEREYAVLDDLLEGVVHRPSRYSSRQPPLAALLEAADAVPIWVISLDNTVFSLDEIVGTVARYRPRVDAVPIAYPHLRSLAKDTTNAQRREYVIVAQR